MRQGGMRSKTADLEQLLLRGKHQPDRTEFVDESSNHVILQRRSSVIRRAAVRVDQDVLATIADQVTVAGHLEVAGIFAIERDGDDGPAFERPNVPVRQLDDPAEAQLSKERRIIVEEMLFISTARHDHRRVFRQVEQGAWIDVVVMVMREEDRGGLGKKRSPQRWHRRFGKPGQEPGIEQEYIVLLAIQERRMPEMNRFAILYDLEPSFPDGADRRTAEALILLQGVHQTRQNRLCLPRCRHDNGVDLLRPMTPVQHADQFPDDRPKRSLIEPDRNGLPFDGMENAQSAVRHGRGLSRLERQFPLEAPV